MAFYIIPFETDIAKKGRMTACPKYLDLIGDNSKGVCSKEIFPKIWVRDFYIVKCADNPILNSTTDVIKLDAGNLTQLRNRLINLGIDMTGITTRDGVVRKVVEWLGHTPKTLMEI